MSNIILIGHFDNTVSAINLNEIQAINNEHYKELKGLINDFENLTIEQEKEQLTHEDIKEYERLSYVLRYIEDNKDRLIKK